MAPANRLVTTSREEWARWCARVGAYQDGEALNARWLGGPDEDSLRLVGIWNIQTGSGEVMNLSADELARVANNV